MGDILKYAWTLYRQNFLLLTGVMLVVWIPCEAFGSWMDFNSFGPDDVKKPYQLHRMLDNFFGIIAISGSYQILWQREADRPVSVLAALGAGFRFWGPMFMTRFIVWVGIYACMLIPIVAGGYLDRRSGSYVGLILGCIIALGPTIYLYLRMSMSEVLVVTEQIYGLSAARRSYHLTKDKFWRILGWLFVGGLGPTVLAMAIYAPFAFVPFLGNWIFDALGALLSDIVLVFYFPLTYSVYLQLLKEGTSTQSEVIPG